MDEDRAKRFDDLGLKGIAKFVLREGVLKYGFPLTALVQTVGYLSKYGPTAAGLGESVALMNLLVFTLTALFEGILFAWMVWNWGGAKRGNQQLKVMPTEISSRSVV